MYPCQSVENNEMDNFVWCDRAPVHATRQRVHAALTNEGELKSWWSAWTGCRITHAAIHPQQGGNYEIRSETKRGKSHFVRGQFLYVSESLLAFTWETSDSNGLASSVFMRLVQTNDNQTEVSIEHKGLTSNLEVSQSKKAWRQILAIMQRGMPRLYSDRISPEVSEYLAKYPECR